MYSASDICMRVFSAKDKNIDILRGKGRGHSQTFFFRDCNFMLFVTEEETNRLFF